MAPLYVLYLIIAGLFDSGTCCLHSQAGTHVREHTIVRATDTSHMQYMQFTYVRWKASGAAENARAETDM